MKKKIILRCLIGAPIGLSISFIITLIVLSRCASIYNYLRQ